MGAQENKCQISKNFENTGKILKIACVRCHFVKFDIYFLGLPCEFFLLLLQMIYYIFSPWKL